MEHEFFKNTAMVLLPVLITEEEKLDLKCKDLHLN